VNFMQFSNLIMSSSQKDRQRDRAPRVDFDTVRKSHKLDAATSATIEEETASMLVRVALFYMTDDRNWEQDDWCGAESIYGAMMSITYPIWLPGDVNIGKRVENALKDALGPNVDVHEIEFDYHGGFAFGEVICTAVPL